MGQPQSSEPASWGVPAVNRVLLLAAEADGPRIELMLPQLQLQGLEVQVEWVSDVDAASARFSGPMVVAVVVSPSFERSAARPFIQQVAARLATGQRLFVLDLRSNPSVVRQCRAVSRTLEGLQRTLEIEHLGGRGLSSSASRGAVVSGSVTSLSGSTADTLPLRVVHPPLLLAWPLGEHAEVIPPSVRHVPKRARPRPIETQPELEPIDPPDSWRTAG